MGYAMESHLKRERPDFRVSKAFSLLELLLVVALIGILAAFAVPTYKTYLQKTRFMEVVQHSHAIRVAQPACLLQVGIILVLVIPLPSWPCLNPAIVLIPKLLP